MRSLIMLIGLSLIPLWGVHAEIREITSMSEIISDVKSTDVVVFDIDNTILETQQTLGSDQWYAYMVEKYIKSGLDESAAIDRAISDWIRVQKVTQVKPVETVTPALIQDLQARGAIVLALTARPIDLKVSTSRQLASIGVHFLETAGSQIKTGSVELYNGILFVGPHSNKGVVLAQYLQVRNLRPSRLIFIDDKEKHVRNMNEVFRSDGILNINYRYGGADSIVKAFRSDIADIEWNYFNQYDGALLTDDEAAVIPKMNE